MTFHLGRAAWPRRFLSPFLVLFAGLWLKASVDVGWTAGADRTADFAGAAGSWAFTPPRDEFSPDSLLDLRALNEKFAGEHGFVTRSADGNDFVFSDGTTARFWAVND